MSWLPAGRRWSDIAGLILVRPYKVRASFLFWGVLASLNIAVGWWVSGLSGPLYADAYKEVRNWLELWWYRRLDVYALAFPHVDYPPNALVALLPMLGIPEAVSARWIATLNIGCSIIGVWLLLSVTSRLAGAHFSRVERGAYALMLLSWTPVRIGIWNGQITPVLLVLLFLALRMAERHPYLAGLALGLGSCKPHLAIPFGVLLLLQRRFATLATGAAVVAALFLAYCASVHQQPIAVMSEYVAQLVGIYGGPTFLRGELDFRPLFIDLLPSPYGVAETIYLVVSVVLTLLLLWLTWRARRKEHLQLLVLSTALLLSMTVFPFRRYGLMAIAPAVLSLVWTPNISRRVLAFLSFVVLSLWIDIPFVVRHIVYDLGFDAWRGIVPHLHYLNRAIVLVFLAWNFWQLWTMSVGAGRFPDPAHAAGHNSPRVQQR